ncbi:MAG TPA: DUF4097 family beta strand repeat-containing protein [Dehalococcoidia bacterium]
MDRYRRSFVRTFSTGPKCRLRVENRNGQISVRGEDVTEVTLRATAHLYADSQSEADREAERIERGIVHKGETLQIPVPDLEQPPPPFFFFGGSARVDYEITAPKDTALSVESRNGRVDVRGVAGAVDIENRNGAVRVAQVAAPLHVQTRNGRVEVTDAGASVDVRTTNGGVSVDRCAGGVTIEATNAHLNVSEVGGGAKLKTTNGLVHYRGEVGGDLEIETVNGPVRLAVPRDSRFRLDAESRFGPVWSDLPVRQDGAGSGGATRNVRLRTVLGPIHIATL